MGWSGGHLVFDPVVKKVLELVALREISEDRATEIIKALVVALEDADWDTQNDSKYFNEPLIRLVFMDLHENWYFEGDEPV
jgi:hypothetical protein